MLKKCFILTQFGTPHPWTQQYFENVAKLEQYGWYWKIFTPNKYENVPANVEIIDMTTNSFNELVEQKLGIKPEVYMTNRGVPSIHMTDFCVMWGKIFEDYIKGFDFWGIPNWDEVYGRLDHFVPDSILEYCDIWTDDVNVINGIFTLFRNREDINNLFKEIPNWKDVVEQDVCPVCTYGVGIHTLFGSDEYGLTEVMKRSDILEKVRYKYPKYYPIHSYDRLETQVPTIKLKMQDDGSLWELSEDTAPPNWIHAHKYIGREIPMYHFIKTKRWPLL